MAIGTQLPLLPLLVLHHHRGDLRFTAVSAHVLQAEARAVQDVADEILFRPGVGIAVAETFRQLGQDEIVVP